MKWKPLPRYSLIPKTKAQMASQTSEKSTLLLYDNINRLIGKQPVAINTEKRFTVIGKPSE